jgi:(p)ppGpp synthase/HD superfamily hydrolase
MLTDRYKDAMLFAAGLHDSQMRKGTEVAYLSHLLAVSSLVIENGGSEDEAIAALLHDAIEDQGDDYESEYLAEPRNGRVALRRDLKLRYGARVLEVVRACTDDEDFKKPPKGKMGTTRQWKARKTAYLGRLRRKQDVGLLRVSCADKLHNARSILIDYEEQGQRLWKLFRAQTKENQLWYYGSLARIYEKKVAASGDRGLTRLSKELSLVVARIEEL